MSDAPSAPGKLTEFPSNEPRLESWGEIATYLRRDIRTVQRWESLHGLPVRRLQIGKQGQVFAFRSELDAWIRKRQPTAEDDFVNGESDAQGQHNPRGSSNESPEPKTLKEKPKAWWKVAVLGLMLLAGLGWINPVHDWFHDILFPPQKKMLLFVRPFASLPPDADLLEMTAEQWARRMKGCWAVEAGDLVSAPAPVPPAP